MKPEYNSNGADDLSGFISVRFRLSTLMLICMHFNLYPLSRAFSNRCVFDENAQRFSVDRRPKRIEMYAFSNENALVWTGPKKPISVFLGAREMGRERKHLLWFFALASFRARAKPRRSAS